MLCVNFAYNKQKHRKSGSFPVYVSKSHYKTQQATIIACAYCSQLHSVILSVVISSQTDSEINNHRYELTNQAALFLNLMADYSLCFCCEVSEVT